MAKITEDLNYTQSVCLFVLFDWVCLSTCLFICVLVLCTIFSCLSVYTFIYFLSLNLFVCVFVSLSSSYLSIWLLVCLLVSVNLITVRLYTGFRIAASIFTALAATFKSHRGFLSDLQFFHKNDILNE